MRRWIPVLLSTLFCATPALADVTLHYVPDGSGTTGLLIQADDHGHIRSSTEVSGGLGGNGGAAYLIDGDQAYLIDRKPQGPALVRIEDAVALAAEARARLGAGAAAQQSHIRATAHGTARVGQWNGNLFLIDLDPPNPDVPRGEIVISNDPALARYGAIALRVVELQDRLIGAALGGPEHGNEDHVFHDLLAGGLLLRNSDFYHLESISTDPIPAERFALYPVLTRDQLRALHGGR